MLCVVRTGILWGTAGNPISVPNSGAIILSSLDRVTSGSVILPPTANVRQWQQNISRDATQCTTEEVHLFTSADRAGGEDNPQQAQKHYFAVLKTKVLVLVVDSVI